MLLNSIFILLILFSLSNCSTFLLGTRPVVNQNIPKLDKDITYELIGWKDKENKIKATEILKALTRSDKFKSISHFVKYKILGLVCIYAQLRNKRVHF